MYSNFLIYKMFLNCVIIIIVCSAIFIPRTYTLKYSYPLPCELKILSVDHENVTDYHSIGIIEFQTKKSSPYLIKFRLNILAKNSILEFKANRESNFYSIKRLLNDEYEYAIDNGGSNTTWKPIFVQGIFQKEPSDAETIKFSFKTIRLCFKLTHTEPTNEAVLVFEPFTADTTKSTTTCGKRIANPIRTLMRDGYYTEEGKWPWHAAILHIDLAITKYQCGGTLISSKIVVTAGHCVTKSSRVLIPERVLVRLGQYNRIYFDDNTKEYQIFEIIVHENYNSIISNHDIALLKLNTIVTFTRYIQPACLWSKDSIDLNSIVNKRGHVIGWGFNENKTLSKFLMESTMPVVPVIKCLNSSPIFGSILSDSNYCAGDRNGSNVCPGDSGGGMFFEKDNVFYLRGIVSLTPSDEVNANEVVPQCIIKHYVLFTDSAKYLDWIKKHL